MKMDPRINLGLDTDVKRSIAGFRRRPPFKVSYAPVPKVAK